MAAKKLIFKDDLEKEAYFKDSESRENLLKKKKKFTRIKLITLISIAAVIIVFLVSYSIYIFSGLPSLQDLENPKFSLATRLFSSDGELIDQLCYQNRTMIPIDSIPKNLINALIATEDHRFYSHWGVDVFRFIKARIKNFPFKIREGASTITQQLARNLYLTMEVTLTRKLREWITAVQIERTYTKDEILSLYLNFMYFGRGAYGVEAAAKVYFDKPVSKLNLSECAFLVGVLKGPENYNPDDKPTKAIGRRNLVLSQMLKEEYIDQNTFKNTIADTNLSSSDETSITGLAPHFSEMIRQQLQRDPRLKGYDIYRDGLRVITTLDTRIQEAANRAVEEHMQITQKEFNQAWNWKRYPQLLDDLVKQAAYSTPIYKSTINESDKKKVFNRLISTQKFIDSVKLSVSTIQVGFVAINPDNGYIRAMVGGSNFKKFRYGLNHVTQIKRQPGSSFKPFTYLTAIDQGISPGKSLPNEKIEQADGTGKIWSPGNSDGRYGGYLALRDGLRLSVNCIAARVITELVTPKDVVKMAYQMGIESQIPEVYSIALGTAEVSPLEMTSAFSTFAADGMHATPIAILRVEDRNGKLIFQNRTSIREAISRESAAVMTNMLEDVVNRGTAQSGVRAYFDGPAAGKTGTTQQMADAWFVGFTKQLAAGVWVGFDDRRIHFTSMAYGQGGRAAAPIWGRFMKYIYSDPRIKDLHRIDFKLPEGVEWATICSETGNLATVNCPTTHSELVISSKKPPPCDGIHKGIIPNAEEKPTIGF